MIESVSSDVVVLRLIDAIATEYEARRVTSSPELESLLETVPEPLRSDLFTELMRIERECGETDPGDLKRRFPQYAEIVESEFNEMTDPPSYRGSTISTNRKPQNAPPGFEYIRILGRGGMGVVMLARQPALHRDVAVKRVSDADHNLRLRFEAQAVAQLRRANIVQVHEVFEYDNATHLVMEYIAGGTLADRIKAGMSSPTDAARLMEQMALGVQAAHAKGIIHRDLKPANILMQNGELPHLSAIPKIADFGLAKSIDVDSSIAYKTTRMGMVVGTPAYMAPEQALGNTLTVATDIYALGVILYEMLAGKPPFAAATVVELLRRVCEEEPTSIRSQRREVPRDLEVICLTCLNKDPARRYVSAEVLADDLNRYLAGEPIAARSTGLVERTVRWARRRPTQATLAVVTAIAIFAGVIGTVYHVQTLHKALSAENAAKVGEHRASESARARLDIALKTHKALLAEVERIRTIPAMRPTHQRLTAVALQGLNDFAIRNQSFEADVYRARAHQQTGSMYLQLGVLEKAAKQFDQTIIICRTLPAMGIEADERNAAWCSALLERAISSFQRQDAVQVEADAREARRVIDEWRASGSTDVRLSRFRIDAVTQLAQAFTMNRRTTEAQPILVEMRNLVLEQLKEHPKDMEALRRMGLCLDQLRAHAEAQGDDDRAHELTKEMLPIARRLAEANPDDPNYHRYVMATLGNLGNQFAKRGRWDEARKPLTDAEAVAKALKEIDPDSVQFRCDWAMSKSALGDLERQTGNPAVAKTHYEAARDALAKLQAAGKLAGWEYFREELLPELERKLAGLSR